MSKPWNETNPEWWKSQIEARGDDAFVWLVNEWAARQCAGGCVERVGVLVSTAGGRIAACERHAAWYLAQGPDIYPVERLSA